MFTRKTIFAITIVFWALMCSGAPATQYYVSPPPDGNDSNTGLSWAQAFATIGKAIDTAGNDDVIDVNEGEYTEPGPSNIIDYNNKAITIRSTDPNNWNVVEATIITSAVLFLSGEDTDSVLTGCTIDNCIDCDGSGPTITKCIITEGIDLSSGGSAVIENNKIKGGLTKGILISAATAQIRNNWIYDSTDGIFIVNATAAVDVNNNTIVDNSSAGIKVVSGTAPVITNCILWDNNDDLSGCTATYSCIEDGDTGTGNISDDPLFVGWLPSDGIISYWELDDGSGTIAEDSVGVNDGNVVNATWTTGKLDGALDFDGSGDYVSIPSIAALEGNSVTIAAWIYGNDFGTSSTYNPILTQYNASNDGYYLYTYGNKPAFFIAYDSGSIEAVSPDAINTGQWYYIVGTNDGTKLKIYVNGALKNEISSLGYTGVAHTAYIGYDDKYNSCFDGIIDDVVIYNEALTDFEIEQMFQRGLNEHNDYHISWYSPCINAGNPNKPDNDESDIDNEDRIQAGRVDIGADETHWGNYSSFGMEVNSVTETGEVITVITTGAKYVLSSSGMDMYRLIDPNTNIADPNGRKVAELTFNPNLNSLTIDSNDSNSAVVECNEATFDFQSDSFFIVTAKQTLSITHTNLITDAPWNAPLVPSERDLDRMWTDGYGGSLLAHVSEDTKGSVTSEGVNSITVSLSAGDQTAHMVFPPKTFDFDGLYGQNAKPFVHFVYSESNMEYLMEPNNMDPYDANGFGVFMLWSAIFDDGSIPKLLDSGIMGYEVNDPDLVNSFVDAAHANDFNVISLISQPSSFTYPTRWRYPSGHPKEGKVQDPAITLQWMREFKDEYNFDGWYFDNAEAKAGDLLTNYDFMRQVRTDVGSDGIIYHHDSVDVWDGGGNYRGLRAIMLDAYVNYTLTGETGAIAEADGPNDPYLRFFTAGYGMSQVYATQKGKTNGRNAISEAEKQRVIGQNLNGCERYFGYSWLNYFKPVYDIRKTEYAGQNFDPDVNWPVTDWFKIPGFDPNDSNDLTWDSNSATIHWTTDVNSDSEVKYTSNKSWWSPNGPDGTVSDSNMVTSHSITLTGLDADTDYKFRIRSTNDANDPPVVPGQIIWGYVGDFKTDP
ncbi:MAG: LamG-like jellyroll fold domain-containing protein [Planctomycetota bacterium]|jgi:hypothetical protein